MHVPADTVYLHVTPGAGGHGMPETREPSLVARDVRDGKISVKRAGSVYRVAVSADGVVDAAETTRLRKK
jgi:N-methylhydantoinase B